MSPQPHRPVHLCPCLACTREPNGRQAAEHRAINRLVALLDEKRRRRFVGFLAGQHGWGGIERLAWITGMSHKTIRRGQREIRNPGPDSSPQVRQPGGGRRRKEDQNAALVPTLEQLLQDVTAGDPSSGMKWTHRSTRKLARALRRLGFGIGYRTVARLLHRAKYSLRTNRKCLAGTHDPQRDRQFRYLVRQRRRYLKNGWPVISVDAKKRELVGNFKNPGRCWRRQARQVLDHDFRRNAEGVAVLYGIYDVRHNDGYVVIGTSHETAAFVVAAIRRWWLRIGRFRYPKAKRLLIEADSGGANGSRPWGWKIALQELADELRLVVCVSHLPSGASKWNLIEHRMFSLISENWAGEPLVSYGVIVELIRHTKSEKGFRCRAVIDRRSYAKGVKVRAQERKSLHLKPRQVLPKWNYVIWPHKRTEDAS
jgi:transposase